MNNIYKVIWSKAKNCYVVASEIARSHTKSASGSEKIGGVTRRSLLASLMALSLLCGGLGVAEASVHVNEVPDGTKEVYTIGETYSRTEADARYAKANDVTANTTNIATNKENITALQTTATKQGELIATNTANIANNTTAIEKKINTETANETFATKDALRYLQNQVTGKVDENTFEDALKLKADTDLSNLTEEGKTAIKTTMADELAKKADAANVYTMDKVDEKLDLKANKAEVSASLNEKADKTALNQATDRITANETAIAGLTTKTTDQQTAIDDLKKKTTQISYADGDGTRISGVTIKNGNIVGDGNSAITQLANVETDKIETDEINGKSLTGTTVATEKEVKDVADAVKTETDERKAADTALEEKIATNTKDIATLDGKVATAEGNITDLKKKDTELEGRIKTNEGDIETNKNAISDINKRTAGIKRDDVRNETTIEGNVTVDNLGNVKAKGVDAGDGAITTKGAVNAGSLNVTDASHLKGDVTMDNNLTVKGDTSLKKTDVDGALNVTGASDLNGNVILGTNAANKVTVNGTANFIAPVNMDKGLTVNGKSDFKEAVEMDKGLTVTNGATSLKKTTVNGKLTAKENAKFEKNVTVQKDLTVDGKLNVGEIYMEHKKQESTGEEYDSATSITADGISNRAKVTDKNGNTTESKFTHNEEGTFNYAKEEKITGEWKGATSNVTADGVSNEMTDSDGNRHTYSQTATESKEQLVNGDKSKSNFEKKTAEGNTISITEKDADGNPKSSLTNTQTVNGEKTSVTNNDSSSTIKQEADQIRHNVTSVDGKKSSIEVKAEGITNTSKDGTITNDAKDIVNNATGNMTNTVGGKLTTTVNGAAEETYKSGLKTDITGDETHTVTGKQINTITNGQENNISGGQKNNILTGNQETTVSNGSIINKAENGDISNTAKNVTNEGTVSVTNKVGANEVKVSTDGVDITAAAGKKITESVGTASRVVENDKITDNAGDSTVTTENGQGTTFGKVGSAGTTNIYGDSIKTGTINANDTTTDKLTAGAAAGADGGRLTVDADGVKGSYKSGDYTSRSYILANTLKSGVDNGTGTDDNYTIGSRTDHSITDDGQAKLDETVKDAAGSNVTNKTSTGTVTTITDGTTTTTTEQGVKDITNTATGGTITNTAKDIVNNAQDTITNTAGTSITNQVKDSTVTTDVDGTTFENKTAAVSDGGTTTTKINGNLINTGRVDANELGVSDKDDQGNTAGLSVKAGEGNKGGIKGYATDKDGNKTYTKVTATENSFQVQDKDGNIKNHQVNTKDSSENTITNGDKTNTVTSTADGTTFNNSKANTAFEGGTYTDTTIKGNTITTGKVTMDYADVMKDLGVRGNANITGKTTTGSLEVKGESKLTGDVTMESNATVKKDLTVEGTTTTNTLKVTENAEVGGTLKVAKKATFEDSVSIAKDLTVGGDVTAKSYKVGDKTYISADGINANDQKITNVADGSISEGSKDAVNGGQLYGMKTDLEHKVDKVGANAAAMANLHPMEFDPDSKWNIAAAMGNYGSETATAIGAFYRPNEDVMVNFSTAFGTGENMVGGGVSVRLGKGSNKLSRQESNALKAQVNDLTARMDALLSVLNPNMSKDFPDVPENHWAYEAVSRLAGNDIVQGYPDGEFHGERTMTRYEMAEIIYNALSRGAEAEKELVEEFKPELQAMAASEKATAEKAEG